MLLRGCDNALLRHRMTGRFDADLDQQVAYMAFLDSYRQLQEVQSLWFEFGTCYLNSKACKQRLLTTRLCMSPAQSRARSLEQTFEGVSLQVLLVVLQKVPEVAKEPLIQIAFPHSWRCQRETGLGGVCAEDLWRSTW